jgi:prepilin-type N-terminal cleavage/methylation domain-containing protein/prepilin-type processing-associated H-X9-DG protein
MRNAKTLSFRRRGAPRRGFTLVELLVVIGIIGVLIGIIVPALTKAREASLRVKCLSNLRQLGTAYQIYANMYKDYIPIGYWSGQKQTNYLINYNEGGVSFYTIMGLLYQAKLLQSPEALYCPAEPLEMWQYNTPSNPWPPVEQVAGSRMNTRAGYGCRPAVNWTETGDWPDPMPRLTKMKHVAMLSDLAPTPYFVTRRHRKGINVYYADGSAKWVDRSAFESTISMIPDITYPFLPSYNDQMLNDDGSPASGIWRRLDKQ